MADQRLRLGVLDERVAAAACVFGTTTPLGHAVHTMAEKPAEIAHLLVEDAAHRIRIGLDRKEQRVAAPHAGVRGVPVPLSHTFIRVVDEKAAERVPHAHHGAVVAEHRAPAPRAGALPLLIDLVLHRVSPDPARQPRQHELCPP